MSNTDPITPEQKADLIQTMRRRLTAWSADRAPIKKYLDAWTAAESAETVEHRMEQKAVQAERPLSP